jgi:hypothetical protein
MRRSVRIALASLAAWVCLPATAQEFNRYEMMCGGGSVVDVTLYDLTQSAVSYDRRAIRTKGRLEINTDPSIRGRVYVLRDMSAGVMVLPVPEVAGQLDDLAMTLMGHEVEVTGCYQSRGASDAQALATMQTIAGVIQTWKILGPPEKPTKSVLDAAKLITLEGLLSDPGRQEGRIIRVVGKFRGRNLYGDLPVRSQRNSSDWVIKDDVFACWIVGKKPKGDGFDLDAGLKRDTNKWLEVAGRVVTRGSVVYLEAIHVSLTKEPRPDAEAKAPPPPPEKPKLPPVVVFALPLDGEQDVPRSTRFTVQFSKDMDETTFKGRIVVRYSGPVRPGDRVFDGVKLSYDQGRRALEVDPGDNLIAGRTVELLLLPGIVDVDGLELQPRPGHPAKGEALDVLRYKVGG